MRGAMSFHSSLPTIISAYAPTGKGRTYWALLEPCSESDVLGHDAALAQVNALDEPGHPSSGDGVAYLEILVTGQEDTGDDVARGARGSGANSQSDQGDGPGDGQSDLFYQQSGVSPCLRERITLGTYK